MVLAPVMNNTEDDMRASVTVSLTTRLIKKGEEIFFAHKNFAGQDRTTRQQRLQGWLPESCRCTKCERGEQAMGQSLFRELGVM